MATAYFCTFVVKKLLVVGRVENWVMMIDLNDISMASIPIKKMQSIIGMTSLHFGGRLFRQFCVNMSWMLRKSSSVLLNLVDDITQQKITVHNDSSYKSELVKIAPMHSLERKYGGLKSNIENNFWPPDMTMPGKQLMTMEQLKEEVPDAIAYFAPWGEKVAREEAEAKRRREEE